MGLDQYGYKVQRDEDNTDFDISDNDEPILISQWRKHPNLEGWMEHLFNLKADAQSFDSGKKFSTEVIANVVGQLNPSEVNDEILSNVVSPQEMDNKIIEQQYSSMSNNLKKERVFNCQYIRLNNGDLDKLEMHIKNKSLPDTVGFFFGDTADDYYYEQDLKFIADARQAIAEGYDVYYKSWW